MGRRRSDRTVTPLRRSSRLRNINPVPEDTEKMDKVTLEEQSEGDEELSETVATAEMSSIPGQSHPVSPEGSSAREQLEQSGMMSPGYYTVVLNRLKLDEEDFSDVEKEEQEKKEDGEKDPKTKAGRHATSRIPTFQSSSGRKRATGQAVEPAIQPPARVESSNLPVHSRAKGSGSGSTRLTGPGHRETALPLPLARLPISSNDAVLHTTATPLDSPVPSHKRSQSPRLIPTGASDSQQLDPLVISARLPIRAETGPPIPYLLSEAAQDVTVQHESVSRGPPPSKDSSTPPLLEEHMQAGENGQISEGLEEDVEVDVEIEPLEEGEETGESDEGSESESEIKEKEPSQSMNGAELQSGGEKAGEEESMDPDVDFELGEAGLSCRHGANGGNEGPKSTGQEVAPGNQSRSRQVSKPEVGEAEVCSYKPASRREKKSQASTKSCWRCCPFFLFLSILLLLIGGGLHLWRYGTPASMSDVLVQLELGWLQGLWGAQEPCSSDCSFALVESIPEGLVFSDGSQVLPSISQAWTQLLSQADSTVSIAAFYFTLRASDQGLTDQSDLQGQQVFDQLMKLRSQGVKLQIAVNDPQTSPQDTIELKTTGAEIREVNLQSVTGGIIHTKLWVVDNKHVYVGSANMDWRSLSQVKEVGVSVGNCSCLAQDVSRVFGVYWYMGSSEGSSLPPYWPASYSALSSSEHPLNLNLNGVPARVYLSSAPPQLSGYGRTSDLSAILSVISDAQKFIFISVMDYQPFNEFTKPPRFWPAIDSALREAACARGVEVNLLVSCWPHSRGSMFIFLESLLILNQHPLSCNIQVKVFEVDSTAEQLKIPYARVNHAKYMVTDRVAYIGTSNWSENYFTGTAGVGLVVNQTGAEVGKGQETVQSQLQEVFQRDWKSRYAQVLSSEHVNRCGKHR
ncbi:5'-3' exonuclease PLD3 [Conger conger]|uniref:5'-3' exonuclease PLD3 n=1 Tax=Conger conger TaxID=82655 RepID=UPI002A59B3EA|nr:5'-3' exonuclease PLD3 [Conger conger]